MSDGRSLIQDVLRPGERLLWTDRPQAWRLALPLLVPLAFVALWAGIPASIFFTELEPGAFDDAPPEFVLLFPGIFILVGSIILLTMLRGVFAAWRTHYGLTDQRAIILVDLWPRSVQSYGPGAFDQMIRTGGDDVGTIRFGEAYHGRRRRGGSDGTGWSGGRPTFNGIANPRRVEALIHENLLKHNKHTESAHR